MAGYNIVPCLLSAEGQDINLVVIPTSVSLRTIFMLTLYVVQGTQLRSLAVQGTCPCVSNNCDWCWNVGHFAGPGSATLRLLVGALA